MLAQVLNRDFMLGSIEATERHVRAVVQNREAGIFGQSDDPAELDTAELRELADTLAEALEGEARAAPPPPPERVEGEAEAPPKDDYVYVPRAPLLGLMQGALERHVAEHADLEERAMLDDRRSGPLPVVTDARIVGLDLALTDDRRRLWGRMEVANPKILSDPGWAHSLWSMIKRARHGRAPFVARPGAPPPLADVSRVVVVGDWGSGLPRARRIAERIAEQLADPAEAHRQKHVIHLGDVYYGGEHDEYVENFLAPWPVAPGTRDVASYTLNGNHDMYSGGHAYFGTALADTRFATQGGSSMFALANDHWQLLGLDTSYEDGGLHGDQADWIRRMRHQHPGRRTMLLSHHQLFSAYEAGATKLRSKMRPVLEEGPIDAWLWGHEHRCLAYRDLENVRFASCLGHGGIPEYLVEQALAPPQGLVYEYRKRYSAGWQPWNTFGFAVLDFDREHVRMKLVDEDGDEHWSTKLP